MFDIIFVNNVIIIAFNGVEKHVIIYYFAFCGGQKNGFIIIDILYF